MQENDSILFYISGLIISIRDLFLQGNNRHSNTFLNAPNSYDAAGNRTGVTDEEGNRTGLAYDALGRLIRVTDPEGAETSYEYDVMGNMTLSAVSVTRFRASWASSISPVSL